MNKLIEFFNEKYGDKYGKIPYPRTTMQIYRVYQSIKSYGIKDEELVNCYIILNCLNQNL